MRGASGTAGGLPRGGVSERDGVQGWERGEGRTLPEARGHVEGDLQRLLRVQARVAVRVVAGRQVGVRHLPATPAEARPPSAPDDAANSGTSESQLWGNAREQECVSGLCMSVWDLRVRSSVWGVSPGRAPPGSLPRCTRSRSRRSSPGAVRRARCRTARARQRRPPPAPTAPTPREAARRPSSQDWRARARRYRNDTAAIPRSVGALQAATPPPLG